MAKADEPQLIFDSDDEAGPAHDAKKGEGEEHK